MRLIETSIGIDAAPDRVWNILVDFDRYEQWNPFMIRARGTAAPGTRLDITMRPEGGRPVTFAPTVTVAEPGRRLQWLGRLWIPKIFDGRHEFTLEPTAGGTTLKHSETFSGLLPPLLGSQLTKTARSFEQFNQAIKARAEKPA